jgi:hypothetical protein
VLLLWALDRLSREGIEVTLRAMRQFADRGVAVWSLRESWTTEPGDQLGLARAKRICGDCQVRAECLEYALERDEEYGVWGGLNRTERVALAG